MFAPLTLAPVPADPPEPLFGNLGSTPALVERWLQESWLARMRWRAVLVGLALVPLFSTISPLLPALLALGLAVGNVRVAWLLRQAPDPARLGARPVAQESASRRGASRPPGRRHPSIPRASPAARVPETDRHTMGCRNGRQSSGRAGPYRA